MNKLEISFERAEVTVFDRDGERTFPMASAEGFDAVAHAYLRCGWDTKHVYSFTWLGRPIIQLPEDLIRFQEVVAQVAPDVIVETGIAHGGSLIFHASLLKAMDRGRVIGVDIDIRAHNRTAIETHPLSNLIALVEGNSVDPDVVARVRRHVREGDTVLVVLDSDHTRSHVLAELEAYSPFVTPGSYIVAADGIMKDLVGAPRASSDWDSNNPWTAAREFAAGHPEFEIVEPAWLFNEGLVRNRVTYWPGAYLRRRNDE